MKHLLLAFLLASLSSACAFADSPEAILKDYRTQATQAVERLNQTLEKAVTPVITRFSQQGDDAGAEQLTNQYKDKLAGEPVPEPQAEVVQIFTLYDEARARALASIIKASVARIESQMKAVGVAIGDGMVELEKVRTEIESGKISKDLNFPSKWLCHSRPGGPVAGEVTFLPDGRWRYKALDEGMESDSGEWVKTKRNSFSLNRRGAAAWTLSFGKDTGILQRPGSGTQFLRLPADP